MSLSWEHPTRIEVQHELEPLPEVRTWLAVLMYLGVCVVLCLMVRACGS